MCVRPLLAVSILCLVCYSGAQTSVDYHQDNIEYEGELQQQQQQQQHELHQQEAERLRLAALQAELQVELKVSQYAHPEEDSLGAIPGLPGQDYPVYTSVPQTSFSCVNRVAGYYADNQARCQVFHICDAAGAKHSFLCPRGSLFSQKYLVCDWWFSSECDSSDGQSYDFNRLDSGKQSDLADNRYYSDVDANYLLLESDIFHSAETGVPNREMFENNVNNDEQVRTNGEERNRGLNVNTGNSTGK